MGAILKWWKPPPSPVGDATPEAQGSNGESGNGNPCRYPPRSHNEGWHPEESHHHSVERFYWRITSFLTFLAAAGAVATVVISSKGLIEAKRATSEAKRQADIAQTAYQEGSRAAISVSSMHWKLPLVKDADNAIIVEYANVGKDSTSIQIYGAPVFNYDTNLIFGVDSISFEANNSCDIGNYTGGNIAAFPSTTKVYTFSVPVKSKIINDVLDNKMIVGVQGCALYADFGQLHWTGFCMVAAKGNETASDADTPYCTAGNFSK